MLRKLMWAIAYRTTQQYNVVKIRSLPPGYYDTDTRIFHAIMQLVVDHVEVSMSAAYVDDGYDDVGFWEFIWMCLPPVAAPDWMIRSRWRGMAFLAKEKKLNDPALPVEQRHPAQAHAASEVETIYLWWVDVRPKRPDPEEMSGLFEVMKKVREYRKKTRIFNSDLLPKQLDAELQAAIEAAERAEKAYRDQDTEMMKRVIDILPYMWI
jgi:hypothetical protein